jgi:CRISPR-associated protein Csm5
MSFLTVTRATLSTLSPVHLGSGEDFLPTNYVIDDHGWLHSFNEMVIAQALEPQKLSALELLIKNEKDGSFLLRKIQSFIYQEREKIASLANSTIPVASGFVADYQEKVGKTVQTESNSKAVLNKLAVMRTFTNPHSHLPIMTGSAIKGAIRTAILNQLAIKSGLKKPQDVRDSRKLPNELLAFRNPSDDPLKLLKISDAEYHHVDNLPATEVLFAVSKRRVAKEGKTAGGPTTYLEAVSGFRGQAFNFDLRFLENPSQDPNRKLPKDIKALASICNDYYLPKLKKELRELNDMCYLADNYVSGLNRLLDGELGVALQQNKAFLLRLGKHSGAYNKTLDNIRAIEIPQHKEVINMRGYDKKVAIKVAETPEVRLAATASSKQAVDLLPFGWVLIELDNIFLTQTHNTLKELALANNAYSQRDKLIQLKQTQEQAKIQLAIDMAERERILANQLADELAQKQVEEAEKIRQAGLPVYERAISNFKKAFEEDKPKNKSKNRQFRSESTLGKQLINFINEVKADWPTETIEEVKKITEEAFKYLGADRKTKGQAKELWQKLQVPN